MAQINTDNDLRRKRGISLEELDSPSGWDNEKARSRSHVSTLSNLLLTSQIPFISALIRVIRG